MDDIVRLKQCILSLEQLKQDMTLVAMPKDEVSKDALLDGFKMLDLAQTFFARAYWRLNKEE